MKTLNSDSIREQATLSRYRSRIKDVQFIGNEGSGNLDVVVARMHILNFNINPIRFDVQRPNSVQ